MEYWHILILPTTCRFWSAVHISIYNQLYYALDGDNRISIRYFIDIFSILLLPNIRSIRSMPAEETANWFCLILNMWKYSNMRKLKLAVKRIKDLRVIYSSNPNAEGMLRINMRGLPCQKHVEFAPKPSYWISFGIGEKWAEQKYWNKKKKRKTCANIDIRERARMG